jgi:excinuclease ABC subunit C
MPMNKTDYDKLLPTLPTQPGIYRFIGPDKEILYVGKAKNLKARLSSYFTGGNSRAYKTRVLVRNAEKVVFTIVDSENDALLLENNLIKKHQPRYNVVWKDDKSYTYICVKKERFPRVFFTRRLIKDGSTYYGPYSSKWKARVVLDVIRSLFPLRTCSLHLTEKNIQAGKFKVCLEYHIKNCLGPCENMESEEEYMQKIRQVKNMLRGKLSDVKWYIKEQMREHAENLEFEKAQQLKDKLRIIEQYQSKSTVVSATIDDADVFSISDSDKSAYINYLKVVDGTVVNTYTVELTKNLDDEPADLLRFAILEIRDRFESVAPEVILPIEVTLPDENIKVTVPQRGDKRALLQLSQKNGEYFLKQKQREANQRKGKKTHAERILNTLKEDLQMDQMPMHIECFDNSNIQGAHPVAACVVLKNAKPAKKDYRHYHVKTVEGPNDFASMEEIVGRRYKRLLKEGKELPQLVIIDGGKGQLNAAMVAIRKLGIEDKMTVIGIAKRLEEIFFPGDSIPLYINKKSESLKLIQQARNEAHRFAINFHRDTRSRKFTKSSLTDIEGVGQKTADKLLRHFKSVKRIREADPEELKKLVGPKTASSIKAAMGEKEGQVESADSG